MTAQDIATHIRLAAALPPHMLPDETVALLDRLATLLQAEEGRSEKNAMEAPGRTQAVRARLVA